MRSPLVRRSRLEASEARADARLALVKERDARLRQIHERYDLVWRDHLARCDCHDSWDQCPCTETGHKELLPEGQSIYDCANKCCRWC